MTLQPQMAAPTQTVPRTPAEAFGRYLRLLAGWLRKNLKEALIVAVIGFVIGWVMNFVLMAFFYDGFRIDRTMAATGQGNVRNGMLIWSLFSSVAFGLIAYRRAVGKERFRTDLANFPGAIVGVFRKDGDAVWTHILWGAAISLLATFLIARWAGLGVAAVLAAAAFSPLGLILAAMITQLWRSIMRSLMPQKTRRAVGAAGLFVGLFTSSLVLLAGFFIANEREKLILGGFCLVAAVVVGMGRKPASATATLLLLAPVLWLLFPELGLADDGGFKEAGGDFSAWARGGGLGEISGYSNHGGVAAAIGGLAGWMVGAVNGASPPPEGGWEAGLDGEPDLDPGGAPAGDGLPEGATAGADAAAEPTDPLPEGAAPSTAAGETGDAAAAAEDPAAEDPTAEDAAAEDAAAAEGQPAGTAAPPEAPEAVAAAAAAPALAADGLPDRELTDDEIAALSEEDYRKWRNRGPAGDPDSPAEILRRARAGDPEAAARWEEIKGEGDPSFLDRAASVVLGPAYDAIGGSETLIELAKTDWIDEGLDTAAALGNAAGRRIGEIADTTVETVSGAIDLAGMDADEVSGMFGAIGDSIANSTVGRIVGETVEGAVELASMDADEFAGMVGQVRDDAADAVVERIDQARTLVEDMTFEEAVGHLERTRDAAGQALTEADRAIRRQAQEVMRMNPDKVRDALADGTIAVVEELVVEVATGGAGAIRHADEAVDLARAADNAADAARAADTTTDVARAADRGADTARAGTPDAPPVRDAPDAPARPDTPDAPEAPASPDGPASPDAPDRPRADAAEPAAPADAAPERRGPGPTEGGRPTPDARARDTDSPPSEAASPGTADAGPPAAGAPARRTGPGDTVELDPSEGPGGVRPPGERPRGPGDTVELDPSDGPGGVRSPDAPRQPAAASPEGAPPARSDEPWTEADTVRTPRRPAEAPGDTDPGRPPRSPSPAPDAPDAPPRAADPGADTVADPPRPARSPDSGDGDLIFEMEDGKRVNMTTNRPEPPRPGSPADLAARGDTPATPRGDAGADTLADGPAPARSPDTPEGDLIFEMEDGKRVNMTTGRPEPPRPGSPADPAVRADTEIMPARPPDRPAPGAPEAAPDGRTGPGDTQKLDPDDLPDARTGPGGTQRLDPDDLPDGRTGPGDTQKLDSDELPDARTGPGGTQRLDPDDLPDGRTGPGDTQKLDPDDLPGRSPQPGDRAPRPLAEREAMANEPYDGPRGMSGKPPQWPDGTRRPPDPSDAAPGDLPRSPTPREGYRTDVDDPPYVDDPNIDARGRPLPEDVAEGVTAPPLPPGHRHNPLDKAYVDVMSPEREAPGIGRGAPGGRDDAIRAAHERYEAGVRQARENLDNPAFRERMNPESLRELEAAVDPANARSLEDFRRSAGMDPTPPPRGGPRPPDTPPMRDGPPAAPDDTPTLTPNRPGPAPDDTPTLTPNRPGPAFTEGDTVLNPGRGPRPGVDSETIRNPGRAPVERAGPGGTQRLDPDDLPDARTGPGGTRRLDPDDLPDSRTGPGGTQRLDPDDLPDGRTGPGGTQRLDPDDLPDARSGPGGTQRLDPDDLPDGRTGPGGTQRLDPDDLPDARTGPGGTQRLDPDDLPDGRTGPGGTQRLDPDDLPDARSGPGGTQRLDPDDLPDGRTGPGGTQRLDPDDLPDARSGPGGTQRLDPDDLPDGRTGPGGTQRLDPDDLPDGRTGPGGTQRLDPDDLPDARSGPGGTQRLDPDDLPGGPPRRGTTERFDPPDLPADRTGPGGTRRLDDGDLPDGRRAAPVDRAPAGPGEEVRPGIRRAPDGTHQVRMPRSEAERILGEAGPGAKAGDTAGEAIAGDRAEAARRANDRFREGMERARRDLDAPPARADGPPEPAPAEERPARPSRRPPRAAEPAQPPPDARAPDPGPDPARPDAPSEAVEEPRPKPRRPRVEPFSRTPLPDVPDADFRRYEDVIGRARQDGLRAGGDWPSGGCEEAKLSLLKQVEGQPGWEGRAARVGPPGKAFDHEFAVSPEGHIVDPVARQFVDRGIWTDARLRKAGLLDAVNRGIFTPEQWARFTFARPQPNL